MVIVIPNNIGIYDMLASAFIGRWQGDIKTISCFVNIILRNSDPNKDMNTQLF